MAYKVNTLAVRKGPGPIDGGPNQLSGMGSIAVEYGPIASRGPRQALGSVWDDIKSAASGGISFLTAQQRAEGAQMALQQENRDLAAALAAQQGPGLFDLALLGGLGYLGYRLFIKK